MSSKLAEKLSPIFSDEQAVLVTDDQELAEWLVPYGAPVMAFDELSAGGGGMPPRVVAMPVDYSRLPSRRALRETLSGSSVLWIPLASFSADLDTAKYAVEMLLEVDFARSVAMNRRIITQLLLAKQDVVFLGPETDLRLRVPDILQLSSRTRLSLLPDEHSTVGNYFEVALSPADLAGRIDSGLSISGTVRVDSVLVAKHRELKGARAGQFAAASEVAAEMRKACPLVLEVRDSRIVDGLGRFADDIDLMSGPEYRGAVTEVAIGTGVLPMDRVDWSRNCVLNESAAGIHLGVGNGLNGMHFDFLAMEASLNGI